MWMSLDFIPRAEGALEYPRQGCGDEKVMLAAMSKIAKEDHSGDYSCPPSQRWV